jgi:hypothetical protein
MSRDSSTDSSLELLRRLRRDDLLRKVVIPYFSDRGWTVSELQREKDLAHGCDLLLRLSANNEPVLAGVHVEASMDIDSRRAARQQVKMYAETALRYRYGDDNRGRLYRYFWITSGRIDPTLRDEIGKALEEADAWGRVEVWDVEKLYEELRKRDLISRLEVFGALSGEEAEASRLPSRPLKVFVSYASEDKGSVLSLVRKLRKDKFDPWLDIAGLKPGQDWEFEIHRAMLESDAILLCLSARSLEKRGFVQKERLIALDLAQEQPEGTIFVIPVMLENVTPPASLRKLQWTRLFERGGYSRLVDALRSREAALRQAGRI